MAEAEQHPLRRWMKLIGGVAKIGIVQIMRPSPICFKEKDVCDLVFLFDYCGKIGVDRSKIHFIEMKSA